MTFIRFVGPDGQAPEARGWRDRWAKIKDSLFNIRRAFVLVWSAHPPSALAMAACSLTDGSNT